MTTEKQFDIVLYGATSFVGQLTAQYFAQFIKNQEINFAIAGRNLEKLMDLSTKLNNPNISLIVANSNDEKSLDDMCSQTKLIISTVGPYLNYGEPVVKSCVTNGTDYIDLCGEMIFVRQMMDKYRTQAEQTGARLVSACGFDSLPSDLGVHYLQQQARAKHNQVCHNVSLKVKAIKGGISGGTVASMVALMSLASDDKAMQKQIADPYLLMDNNKPSVKQTPLHTAKFDPYFKKWQAPFIMEATNSRMVHFSNYLSDFAYGKDFRYEEISWLSNSLKGRIMATNTAIMLGGFYKAVSYKKSRQLLTKYVLPKAGTGPSKEQQETGFFDLRLYGYADDTSKKANQPLICVKVTGQKDPGYGSTAMMLAQAGLCLAFDIDKQTLGGGFYSPAFAMGDKLIEHLQAHAMVSFEVVE